MRIVGGKSKGRQIKSLKNRKALRPLSEQVREALFNILGEGVLGTTFLDLFAGTGAVGIEALSRGANRVFFVENHLATAKLIKANLELLGYSHRAEVYALDVKKALKLFRNNTLKFEWIFVGAPYLEEKLLEETLLAVGEGGLLKPKGNVIAEHHKKTVLKPSYGVLQFLRAKSYGDTVLAFYGQGEI